MPAKANLTSSCADDAGRLIPVIDRNRCEAKGDCVQVCPYDVFEIGRLSSADRAGLSLVGRIKAFAHAYQQAFAVHADRCHGCGLCVQACPEKAIELRSATSTAA